MLEETTAEVFATADAEMGEDEEDGKVTTCEDEPWALLDQSTELALLEVLWLEVDDSDEVEVEELEEFETAEDE